MWLLDSNIHFLNHGSFGATPIKILEYQQELREQLEQNPVKFLARDLEYLLDEARRKLANFLQTEADNLVFIPNATLGVNTVLNSLTFQAGDEILTTNHIYNACHNALNLVSDKTGAKIVVAAIPFPLNSSQEVVNKVLEKISDRTKLIFLDHITSPTALIYPIEEILAQLAHLDIDILIDGAHAPGHLPLDLNKLGVAYYTGNCHKWMCCPKGAGFLYVREDKQAHIRPLSISHGANSPRIDKSRFQLEFDWTGTDDPTPYLCISKAISYLGALFPGGWLELQQKNHQLTLEARDILADTLKLALPAPNNMIGCMASLPLNNISSTPEALQKILFDDYKIEIPIIPWSNSTSLIRISVQLYNSLEQYQYLAQVLTHIFR